MTCRVLYFGLSIKGKTLTTFYCCCLYCVYESLLRSRGICLHTYLGLSRSRLMSRAWWSFQLLHKELKEKHKWCTCGCCESKKEVIRRLRVVTCRVLCFALSIKGKTLTTFYCCCLCCVYESLVRSRGVCLHTYLGLSRSRLMSRAWWSF